jgi:hypothetical protein
MKRTNTLLTAALGVIMTAHAQLAAQAQTFQINTLPYTITVPGVYTLERNFTSAAPVLITITSPDVTLDLGSHILSSTNPSAIACINVYVKGGVNGSGNITIRNGTIRNLATSITVSNNFPNDGIGILIGTGGLLENLSIYSDRSSPIAGSVVGIIRDCIVRCGPSNQPAIFLRGAGGDIITHNIIYPGFTNIAVMAQHSVHATEAIFGNVIFLTTFSQPGFNPVNDNGTLIPNTLDTVFRNPG